MSPRPLELVELPGGDAVVDHDREIGYPFLKGSPYARQALANTSDEAHRRLAGGHRYYLEATAAIAARKPTPKEAPTMEPYAYTDEDGDTLRVAPSRSTRATAFLSVRGRGVFVPAANVPGVVSALHEAAGLSEGNAADEALPDRPEVTEAETSVGTAYRAGGSSAFKTGNPDDLRTRAVEFLALADRLDADRAAAKKDEEELDEFASKLREAANGHTVGAWDDATESTRNRWRRVARVAAAKEGV